MEIMFLQFQPALTQKRGHEMDKKKQNCPEAILNRSSAASVVILYTIVVFNLFTR